MAAPTTPAEELRAAARLLRETASKATPGPWHDFSTDEDGAWPVMVIGAAGPADDRGQDVLIVHETVDEEIVATEDAAWIALASPALAEPLAAVLDDHAQDHSSYDCTWPEDECPHVRLARVINGRTS